MESSSKTSVPKVFRLDSGLIGRIVWVRPDGVFMLSDDVWIPAVGVTGGDVFDSKPLTTSEIEDLISKGILPKHYSPKL